MSGISPFIILHLNIRRLQINPSIWRIKRGDKMAAKNAIDLGLVRMQALMKAMSFPQNAYKSIHIAGTNGKGSTVSCLASILSASNLKTGKFTSPHLVSRNDSIAINGEPISLKEYERVEKEILRVSRTHSISVTPFEILTAAAFQIFRLNKVDLAVIEVGMGGRLDSTNVMKSYDPKSDTGVIATGITKISMDHESMLGSTLSAISGEKAGIMKRGIPCVYDGSNNREVVSVLKQVGQSLDSSLFAITKPNKEIETYLNTFPLEGDYQFFNMGIALKIIDVIKDRFPGITRETISKGLSQTRNKGRLTWHTIEHDSKCVKLLLDGAHNESAAIELGHFIDTHLRTKFKKITFITAMTSGKDVDSVFKHVFTSTDNVVTTTFGPVDNMPWITCCDPESLCDIARKYTQTVISTQDLKEALTITHDSDCIVVCGSLYLVGEIYKL